MIDVLQKRKQAKQILNEVEIEAELMYESVSEAIKDINLPNYKLDYQLLEKIDNFLKLYAIINKEQYILNGELINYKLEIIEPLQNVIDMNEEYNPFMEIEEIEELEELKHFYDFHIIFVLYFKWHITKELQDLNLLVDYFIYYFDGSNIFPIDINEYSKNQL